MREPLAGETERDIANRLDAIDGILKRLEDALVDLSRLCEVQREQERRLTELEAKVNRISGIVMDLKESNPPHTAGGDRIDTLEAAVKRITATAEEQRTLVESHISEQRRMMEELRKELTKGVRQEEEPAIFEIEDLFRKKRR